MSTVTYVLAIIVMGLVAIVLVRGLFNMTQGRQSKPVQQADADARPPAGRRRSS